MPSSALSKPPSLPAPARLALLLGLLLPGCRRSSPPDAAPPAPSMGKPPGGSGGDSGVDSGRSGRSGQPARGDNASLLLGNPSSAGSGPDNLLLEIPQYSLAYNASAGGPRWVCWHLEASDLGSAERSEFRPNTALPAALQIRPGDYRGSGYDRGHLCPSGDRTRRRADNEATFLMSNMLPQAPALNQHVWKDLEDHCRDLAEEGFEMYIAAGGAGSSGRIAGGRVNVPSACWKVIVVIPRGSRDLARIDARARVIAVAIPNQDTDEVAQSRWSEYLISPARIEKATGLRFFTTLPAPVRAALESKIDRGDDDTPGARPGGGRGRA